MTYGLNWVINSYCSDLGIFQITRRLLCAIFCFLRTEYFICNWMSEVDDNRIVLCHYLLKSVKLSLFHCIANLAISSYPTMQPNPFLQGDVFNLSPLDLQWIKLFNYCMVLFSITYLSSTVSFFYHIGKQEARKWRQTC